MGTETAIASHQYLTFYMAGEEYAISILRVKEIIEFDQITKVPQMPNWIRGVINLRSSVVPVIDLSVKFGLPETKVTKQCCIIIVETELDGEPIVMGVMAESVRQVVDLAPEDIQRPPAFGTNLKADFLLGMAKLGKKFALILDIDGVLSADELLEAAISRQELTRQGSAVAPQMSVTRSADTQAC